MNDSRNEVETDDARHAARVCVPVRPRRVAELAETVERASREADLVEIRFDYLEAEELEAAPARLPPLLDSPKPLVFTLRQPEQGGARATTGDERERFWRRLTRELQLHADAAEPNAGHERGRPRHFADLELDGGPSAETCDELARVCRIIRSHHDFAGGAEDASHIYERLAATDADTLKLAVTARDVVDCLPVFQLLERARSEGRRLVAVAMGQAGVATRVLGPSRGAPFTYAALDPQSATAPGQRSSQELRGLYRLDSIDSRTLITGLVGSPVAHSLSPLMHNRALAARGLNAVYLPFEVTNLAAFVRRMVRPATRELEWSLRGLSVTAPHKTDVMTLLDRATARASFIGAVNTVTVETDGTLVGDNTDADAFAAPLRHAPELLAGRVALIGAGGAARAVAWTLKERGARVTVFARDAERTLRLADDFDSDAAPLGDAPLGQFDLVVNATPLGTGGPLEELTPATAEQLRGARLAYDLVYNPSETRFLREARAAGCRTVGGLAMLVAQGEEQFRLWTGEDAPDGVMRSAAEGALK